MVTKMENYFMHYDPESGEIKGFYLKSIHVNIPSPTIEIIPEKHEFYMENNGRYKLNPVTLEDELIPIPEPVPQPLTELEILKNRVAVNQGAIDFIILNF